MEIKDCSWCDVKEYLKKHKTIIIPLGSIEQHSPALPLGTDAIIAEALAKAVASKTKRIMATVLSPGISLDVHMEFEGTISFMPNTFTDMVKEYIQSLYTHGFRNFLLINGHGGNDGSIKNAMAELSFVLDDIKYQKENWWRMSDISKKAKEVLGHSIGHACATEASLIMHINEKLVKTDKLSKEFAKSNNRVSNNLIKEHITKTGIINADQTKASKELGKEIFDMAVNKYIAMLNEIET